MLSRRLILGLFGAFPSWAADQEVSWLDVPYVPQIESGCGAASIAMVMQYWIRQEPSLDVAAANGDRIYRLLAVSGKGISGDALKSYLEQHGFDAFTFNGTWEDVEHHLKRGRPLVLCFAPAGRRGPLHYAVIVGASYGAGLKKVILHDPTRGKLFQEKREPFERQWKATGYWTLLAVPRQSK